MAVFAYRVARSDGSMIQGSLEGDGEAAVRAKLESQGLLVFPSTDVGRTQCQAHDLGHSVGFLSGSS